MLDRLHRRHPVGQRQHTARTIPLRNQFTTLRYANQTARLYGAGPLRPTAAGQHRLGRILA